MKPDAVLICTSVLLILLAAASGCTTPAAPAPASPADAVSPPATAQEIKAYVDRAAGYAKGLGSAAALAEFGSRTGRFVTGDVYVYALDYNGTALALPFQPEKVGTDFRPIRDATGKPFTEIEIQLAKAGGGYILYHYPVPADNTSSRLKISYVRPVDSSYWIGAGVYTSEDLLVDPALKEFLAGAKTYGTVHGRQNALAAFNDRNGSFVRGDLYIFAYDYNGTLLAWPYRPDLVGTSRLNATDPVGSYHIREMAEAARNGSGMVDYYSVNPATNATDLKISYVTDMDGTWFIGTGRYIEPGPVLLRP